VRAVLRGWLLSGEVWGVWIAAPCGTFSLARRGGGTGPPTLRSAEFPLGLPGLEGKNLEKVQLGNRLMVASAEIASLAVRRRIVGGLENPAYSRLWLCRPIDRLVTFECVQDHFCDFCQYGTGWRKRTRLRLWHARVNDSEFRMCQGKSICSTSLRPHIQLVGCTSSGKFLTSVAEPYPRPLCTVIARVLERSRVAYNLGRSWDLIK